MAANRPATRGDPHSSGPTPACGRRCLSSRANGGMAQRIVHGATSLEWAGLDFLCQLLWRAVGLSRAHACRSEAKPR